jgi:hypothetical protein
MHQLLLVGVGSREREVTVEDRHKSVDVCHSPTRAPARVCVYIYTRLCVYLGLSIRSNYNDNYSRLVLDI